MHTPPTYVVHDGAQTYGRPLWAGTRSRGGSRCAHHCAEDGTGRGRTGCRGRLNGVIEGLAIGDGDEREDDEAEERRGGERGRAADEAVDAALRAR